MTAMTLEQVRDYLRFRSRYIARERHPEHTMLRCVEALDSHLSQPVQAVDVEKDGGHEWCDCKKLRVLHLKGEFSGCHYYCKCDGCGKPVIGGPCGFPDVLCKACSTAALTPKDSR